MVSSKTLLIDRDHAQRGAVETFIAQRYRDCYGAHISHFPNQLIAIYDRDGRLRAACGLRDAAEGFISSQYLATDITHAVRSAMGQDTSQEDLVEFTTLAADNLDHLMQVLTSARDQARAMGKRLAVFTTTELISRILRRQKVRTVFLSHADIEHAPAGGPWGDYYGPETNVYLLPDHPRNAGNLFVSQKSIA